MGISNCEFRIANFDLGIWTLPRISNCVEISNCEFCTANLRIAKNFELRTQENSVHFSSLNSQFEIRNSQFPFYFA